MSLVERQPKEPYMTMSPPTSPSLAIARLPLADGDCDLFVVTASDVGPDGRQATPGPLDGFVVDWQLPGAGGERR